MFKSAVWRLTLVYVGLVMLISVIFSVVLYGVSSREIGKGLAQQGIVIERLQNGRMPIWMDDLAKARQSQIEESNRHLLINLIYLNLFIFLASAGASYLLAKQTLRPIEEMVEEQNRFSSDASHELRTPLAAMKAETEVSLRDEHLTLTKAKDQLKSNLEELDGLEKLVGYLLKLNKFTFGQQLIESSVNLEDAVVKAYERAEKSALAKNIVFENELSQVWVGGDFDGIVEMIYILIDNAIKYSPEKSKIKIKLSADERCASISIIDEGTGIKAGDIPHIFKRFYRADSSRSKIRVEGYGLGLSIAQQIAETHKAKIKVTSDIGHGSTFKVTFLLYPPKNASH